MQAEPARIKGHEAEPRTNEGLAPTRDVARRVSTFSKFLFFIFYFLFLFCTFARCNYFALILSRAVKKI
jgi:hypothetical protein